jgi:predicted metal-dependent hydrolase
VNRKSAKIAALIADCQGRELDAHYLGYFELFNRGLFYEAHDVLEELWLADRHGPNGAFYKGLIQFAGAFVHLQKGRLKPAAALFQLARANLERYGAVHMRLNLQDLLTVLDKWCSLLEINDFSENPIVSTPTPRLALVASTKG